MNSHGVVSHDAGREPWKASSSGSSQQGQNAKIAKKYFPMSEWGVLYTIGKLKRRAFQQAKEHADRISG